MVMDFAEFLGIPRTSSLHSTSSTPRSLTALHVYFPPSNKLGFRMFKVSTPWLFCMRNFGSSPIIILFFIQIIFGWQESKRKSSAVKKTSVRVEVFIAARYANVLWGNHGLRSWWRRCNLRWRVCPREVWWTWGSCSCLSPCRAVYCF